MNGLQNVEYNGTLVLTTQQIAEAYGTNTDVITKNFNRNKERYTDGKHYICLKGEDLKAFRCKGQIDLSIKVTTLYLWTKHGAFLHAKSLNTDTAWEVYEKLVDNYFQKPQETLVDRSQLSPQMQMVLSMAESMAKQELEQKRQAEQIAMINENVKELQAKVETHNEDYYTVAGYASLRGIKVDINKANMLGRKCSKLSKSYGYDVGKTKDPRFGTVNTYHVDILKEAFS